VRSDVLSLTIKKSVANSSTASHSVFSSTPPATQGQDQPILWPPSFQSWARAECGSRLFSQTRAAVGSSTVAMKAAIDSSDSQFSCSLAVEL